MMLPFENDTRKIIKRLAKRSVEHDKRRNFFIISTINLSFLFVQAMTSGKPDGASEVFLSYMYGQAYTNSSYGYGMAIGVVVFLFSFGLAGLVNLVTKREPLEF